MMNEHTTHATGPAADVMLFEEIDAACLAAVGAKGAHLAALARLQDIRVPPGFCVTTFAFQQILAQARSLEGSLDRLARLGCDEQGAIRDVSAEIRDRIVKLSMPEPIAAAIAGAHAWLGAHAAYAVRSSATAEDSPMASFAGQQDSYLNVVGLPAVLRHIQSCWASLFTERAVAYRLRNGFDHRKVQMAVVVQQMVFPHASGVLFTADAVTGNRNVMCIAASFGLGEAVVSGLVNADAYKLRDGTIVSKMIGCKHMAIVPSPAGGTHQRALDRDLQKQPALTDEQVLRMEDLGRRIEGHFGCPQDIEWCLLDDVFHIVQSRPITTLFPLPNNGQAGNRVYVSVGHQQMMTDPLRPLGLSFWQLTAQRPMAEAGGRLFVDVTQALAAPGSRAGLFAGLGKSDPLIGDALQSLLDRGDFITSLEKSAPAAQAMAGAEAALPIETDAGIVSGLIARSQAAIASLAQDIQGRSGPELLNFILADIEASKRFLFDATSMQVIMASLQAAAWLNDQLEAWIGVKKAADTLAQSVQDNVTSQMGLALLDVADAIRPHPEVTAYLQTVEHENFLETLPNFMGGRKALQAIEDWLAKYGMRGVGEIDITRPRFRERPKMLLPMILGNVRNFAPGEGTRRFEQGLHTARVLEQQIMQRLHALPDGVGKAEETKRMIARLRTFAGYREYPKYAWVSHEFIYKRALMEEAARLVQAGVLRDTEDVFYLRFEELQAIVRTHEVDALLIQQRKEAFKSYHALKPPRVLTSDGEAIAGTYRLQHLPTGALVGMAVSAGIVEGRARVVLDLAKANLEPDDILITTFTDPSWTPLFVAVKGLVTEVGGLMTHGAVIAREYGLPAVVGVENATILIKDGQRIRVNGTNGYVQFVG